MSSTDAKGHDDNQPLEGSRAHRQDAAMRGYVGITDADWALHLSARPELDEINFWQPSGDRQFRVLKPGEPFLFKTHMRSRSSAVPGNRIIGGAFFQGFSSLTVSEAWAFFGEGNGAASLPEMLARINRYRRSQSTDPDPRIGCILLNQPVWLSPDEAFPAPHAFAPNIVQGRGYDLDSDSEALTLFSSVLERATNNALEAEGGGPWVHHGDMQGTPTLIRPRLGQGSFQARIMDAYAGQCAITKHKIRPTLQAAHILPVSEGGKHRVDNGLLLRSDVHTLFDRGYLGVSPDLRLHVSPRLKSEFGNGQEFYDAAGQPIVLPQARAERPSGEFLTWHMDTVFKAS